MPTPASATTTLYHLWKPWDSINPILILAPMVYAVWRTKDIRIGIAVHIMLNSLARGRHCRQKPENVRAIAIRVHDRARPMHAAEVKLKARH